MLSKERSTNAVLRCYLDGKISACEEAVREGLSLFVTKSETTKVRAKELEQVFAPAQNSAGSSFDQLSES